MGSPSRTGASATPIALAMLLVAAINGAPPLTTARADATAPTVLDATLAHLGMTDPPVGPRDALEVTVGEAITRGVLSRGVMTVLAGGDPLSVDPMLCSHLRREQRRWADVGEVWTRAYATLGADLITCDLSGDTPCAVALRLRLQTVAGDELAMQDDCDLDCAHRLERLQQKIERTASRLEQLDAAGIDIDVDVDVAMLVRDAATTWDRLAERIRTAQLEAPVPDPGFDAECEAVRPFGPGGRP